MQAQKARAETPSGFGFPPAFAGQDPAFAIAIDELLREPDRSPFRARKAAGTVELRPHAFVECHVRTLDVIEIFNYVKKAVAGVDEKRLRASLKFLDNS